jgi:hypothetical protein
MPQLAVKQARPVAASFLQLLSVCSAQTADGRADLLLGVGLTTLPTTEACSRGPEAA